METQGNKSFWTYPIGIGIALSPVHNVWLTEHFPWIFIPQLGYLLLLLGSGLLVLNNWEKIKESGWGDSRIFYGIILIATAIALSGTAYADWGERLSPTGIALGWIALYLSARFVGQKITIPLAVGSALASVDVIVSAIIHPGELTGGLIFEYNYDIVVGYILLGMVLYDGRWKRELVALSLVGVFLTGSPEGIFALFVIGLAVVIRKDWHKSLFYVLLPLVAVCVVWTAFGWTQELYSYGTGILQGSETVPVPITENATTSPQLDEEDYYRTDMTQYTGDRENALIYRFHVIDDAMSDISMLGEGYNLTAFRKNTVHNVPLILVQQLGWTGVLAGVVWLLIGVTGWRNRKWRYAWVMTLALSVFDHFTWTQMASYWWILTGLTFRSDNELVVDKVEPD